MSTVIPMADSQSECSHTPGPWMIGDESKGESPLLVYCDDALGSLVADLRKTGHGISVQQDRANARLIAAAPDLLEALDLLYAEVVAAGLSSDFGWPEAIAKTKAAIAKAEGRS